MNMAFRVCSVVAMVICVTGCGGDSSGVPKETTLVTAQPVPLIIDTDFSSDVDDVGALAIANALVDNGEARLLAVMVNTPSRWGAPAVDAVNTWYGHGDVPIGTLKPVDDSRPFWSPDYPKLLATSFPNSLQDGANASDAVSLYREILAKQPDHSVVIVSIGFLNNLQGLLDSGADAVSALDGKALVAKKVAYLDLMGGQYPSGKEFNFYSNPAATRAVVNNWPTRIIFNGFEVGNTVMTGRRVLTELSANNPVRAAYALYLGTETSRPSWDPVSVYTAIRGTDSLFKLAGQGGTNTINAYGGNSFDERFSDPRNNAYLVKKATDTVIAEKLEALMLQGPKL